MRNEQSFAYGLLIGAALMYLLDPDRGRRRRALLRDQVIHRAHELEDLGGSAVSTARDLRNRARGLIAETRSRLRHDEVDDPVLEARVRSELGRLTTHPGAVQVRAEHGRVTLVGRVLAEEVEQVVEGVQAVPGVVDVINRMEERDVWDVSGWQGG